MAQQPRVNISTLPQPTLASENLKPTTKTWFGLSPLMATASIVVIIGVVIWIVKMIRNKCIKLYTIS